MSSELKLGPIDLSQVANWRAQRDALVEEFNEKVLQFRNSTAVEENNFCINALDEVFNVGKLGLNENYGKLQSISSEEPCVSRQPFLDMAEKLGDTAPGRLIKSFFLEQHQLTESGDISIPYLEIYRHEATVIGGAIALRSDKEDHFALIGLSFKLGRNSDARPAIVLIHPHFSLSTKSDIFYYNFFNNMLQSEQALAALALFSAADKAVAEAFEEHLKKVNP